MAIKKLLQAAIVGGDAMEDSLLHSQTVSVQGLTEEVSQLIRDLRDTIWAYPFCVGLSAPQIGSRYAVSVVNFKKETSSEDIVLINPQIISTSGKKDRKRESCMSVWGEMGEVERREKVIIEYRDEAFILRQSAFRGFEARVVQHELDHLQGILFSDKIYADTKLQHADFFDGYKIIEDNQ